MSTTTTTTAIKPFVWNCEQCFDTEVIDRAGAEIPCPYCVAVYHPRSVTIVSEGEGSERRFFVIDRSQHAAGVKYGAACRNYDEAQGYQRRRQGVIKAALTRRANKRR